MFKKRAKVDKSAIRNRKNEGEEEDETTTVIRPSVGGENSITATETREAPVASTVYSSSGDAHRATYSGDATHISEVDTAVEKDSRTILERNMKLQQSGVLDSNPNIYRGQSAYRSFVHQDPSKIGANKYTGTQGPIRAPSFVRSSARFDYQVNENLL